MFASWNVESVTSLTCSAAPSLPSSGSLQGNFSNQFQAPAPLHPWANLNTKKVVTIANDY